MNSVVYTVLVVPVIVIIILWIYHNWLYQRAREAARNLPTLGSTLPLLGNSHHMLIKSNREKYYFDMVKNAGEVGPTTCVWFGPHPLFVLNHAEDIQAVLSESKTRKSGQYELLKFVFGEGLLTATEEVHSITRRYINPLFQPRNLEKLMVMFNETSRHLVHILSEHVGREEFDMFIPVGKTSLMNISYLIFGTELIINMNSKEFEALTALGTKIGGAFFKRLSRPWLWFERTFRFVMKQEIREIYQLWRQFADGPLKMTEQRANQPERKYRTELGLGETPDNEGELPEHATLYDMIRKLKEDHPGFTDDHHDHEMITLVMAGTDTTRVTIVSCLLAIADNSDVQEKLVKEISQVMGSLDNDVTVQDLHCMPYLDQVLKETLRKYTIIPFVLRKAKEDIKLRDCTVPQDASIVINFIGLHHNSSEFPEPNIFDPERFSPERVANMKRFAYLPFSGGSRKCIGSIYSAMLVKTVVVHILRRYRLTTSMDSNNLKYKMGISLVSHKGYQIKLHDRC